MAPQLCVMLRGRVQAILSAFKTMKLEANLHFFFQGTYINVTYYDGWKSDCRQEELKSFN